MRDRPTNDTVAVLTLVSIATLLSSLALVGLARGAEPVSPTLAVLLEAAPFKDDRHEPKKKRRARLTEIAKAIDEATPRREERALLLALGWHESRWSSAVCSGEQLGDKGRAYGCWQSWEADRSGGIRGQVERALRHLRRAANYCRSESVAWARGAMSLYATGATCQWSGVEDRLETWRRTVQLMALRSEVAGG